MLYFLTRVGFKEKEQALNGKKESIGRKCALEPLSNSHHSLFDPSILKKIELPLVGNFKKNDKKIKRALP